MQHRADFNAHGSAVSRPPRRIHGAGVKKSDANYRKKQTRSKLHTFLTQDFAKLHAPNCHRRNRRAPEWARRVQLGWPIAAATRSLIS